MDSLLFHCVHSILELIVDQFFSSGTGHSFANKRVTLVELRELHVYLSWNPCWATMPYEDPFTTYHVTPNHPGSVLDIR